MTGLRRNVTLGVVLSYVVADVKLVRGGWAAIPRVAGGSLHDAGCIGLRISARYRRAHVLPYSAEGFCSLAIVSFRLQGPRAGLRGGAQNTATHAHAAARMASGGRLLRTFLANDARCGTRGLCLRSKSTHSFLCWHGGCQEWISAAPPGGCSRAVLSVFDGLDLLFCCLAQADDEVGMRRSKLAGGRKIPSQTRGTCRSL